MYFSDTVIAVVVIGYVILRERSEALHTSLSFRTQYPVILRERSEALHTLLSF